MAYLLFKEYPYAAVVKPEYWDKKICHLCFRVSLLVYPCSTCLQVKYCSRRCATLDWISHKRECQLLVRAKDDPPLLKKIIKMWNIRLFARIWFTRVSDFLEGSMGEKSAERLLTDWPEKVPLRVDDPESSAWKETAQISGTQSLMLVNHGHRNCGQGGKPKGLFINHEDGCYCNPFEKNVRECYEAIQKKHDDLMKTFFQWFGKIPIPKPFWFHHAFLLHIPDAFACYPETVCAPITVCEKLQEVPKEVGFGFYLQISRFNRVCGRTNEADVEILSKPEDPSLQIVCSNLDSHIPRGKLTPKLLSGPRRNSDLTRFHKTDFFQMEWKKRFLPCSSIYPFQGCSVCRAERLGLRYGLRLESTKNGRNRFLTVNFFDVLFPMFMANRMEAFEEHLAKKEWEQAISVGRNIAETVNALSSMWRTTAWKAVFCTKMGKALRKWSGETQVAVVWYEFARDAWASLYRQENHPRAQELDLVIQTMKELADPKEMELEGCQMLEAQGRICLDCLKKAQSCQDEEKKKK